MKIPSFLRSNALVPDRVAWMLIVGWIIFLVGFWSLTDMPLIPTPLEAASALQQQWLLGAGAAMLTSLRISLEAVFCATVIGLGLSYLSTIPLFRAPVKWIGNLRFLSLTGVIIIFLLATPNPHWLKVSVLTFAIVTVLVNDMTQVIDDIPTSRFDHARALGMSDWQVTREVVIRGTLATAFESIRNNTAMAWMMLTMVEGLSRSEGGIGVLLLNLSRTMNYEAIFGIQFMIFVVGLVQDYTIKFIKGIVCPYAKA